MLSFLEEGLAVAFMPHFVYDFLRKIFIMLYFFIHSSPTPQNGQTHSNNSSAEADGLLECV